MGNSPVGWVRQHYLESVGDIREELRSYWLNHAFLLGYQWIYFDTVNNQLDEVPADIDRIQPTMNRMRSNVRTIMSNLTQRELTFENPPHSYDDATIRAARIGEAVLEDLRRNHNWEVLREKHMIATLKGGTAAISVDWDDENKTTVETVLPLGDFVVEPGAIEAETARWWIRKQVLPSKEVQAIYPEAFPDQPPPADSQTTLDPYMQRVKGKNDGAPNRTYVLTYYERPNPLCPEGRFAVEIDNKIVQHGVWPFPWKDRLNIAIATETAVENQWYGSTILDDARCVQVALNAAWANILEHLRDAGASRLAYTTSNADNVRVATDRPGEGIEYADGTTPPMYLSPAQLASWIRETPGMLAAHMDDILGVHDVTRGQAPANIESGLGLSILAEKDSSPIGRLIKEAVRCWSHVAEMCLKLHEKNVKSSRETTIIDGSVPTRFDWKGSDLQGQTAARVPLDAIVPRSRAAQQAFADKAMEMKLISNVVQYAKVADLPGQDDIIAAAAPDVAKARRENAAFVLSEVMLPADFDDHAMHIEVHNEFRKTLRYEQLSDEDRAVVDDHIMAHMQMAAEQVANAEIQAGASPALQAAPNADGSQIDPALLVANQPPPPPPEVPEMPMPPSQNPAIDPMSMTADMLALLER